MEHKLCRVDKSVEWKNGIHKWKMLLWKTVLKVLGLTIRTGNQNELNKSILQTDAYIFDNIGFLSPFTIRVKFIFQKMWEHGLWIEQWVTWGFAKCLAADMQRVAWHQIIPRNNHAGIKKKKKERKWKKSKGTSAKASACSQWCEWKYLTMITLHLV